MQKQTYTEGELYNKIYWIENNYDKMIQYNIIIENDTENEVIEFIKKNISGYYTTDYDMDTYDIKTLYNNIFVQIIINEITAYTNNMTDSMICRIIEIIDPQSDFFQSSFFLHPLIL